MKKLIAVIALVFSAVAIADSAMIYETRASGVDELLPEFEINKELGRAWVNVVERQYWGDDSTYHDNRVLVEGLSYDANEKVVIFEKADGERVVCSKHYNRRWVIDIGGSLNDTGKCKFSVKSHIVEVDNGFEINKVKMLQVFLNVE